MQTSIEQRQLTEDPSTETTSFNTEGLAGVADSFAAILPRDPPKEIAALAPQPLNTLTRQATPAEIHAAACGPQPKHAGPCTAHAHRYRSVPV